MIKPGLTISGWSLSKPANGISSLFNRKTPSTPKKAHLLSWRSELHSEPHLLHRKNIPNTGLRHVRARHQIQHERVRAERELHRHGQGRPRVHERLQPVRRQRLQLVRRLRWHRRPQPQSHHSGDPAAQGVELKEHVRRLAADHWLSGVRAARRQQGIVRQSA